MLRQTRFNGNVIIKLYRVFEVRGSHLEYKPPEVKSTNIHKMTKATINRIKNTEDNEKRKQEIRDERKKSNSRSKSKSPKPKKKK